MNQDVQSLLLIVGTIRPDGKFYTREDLKLLEDEIADSHIYYNDIFKALVYEGDYADFKKYKYIVKKKANDWRL
mgnify:CR=1 FL=1